MTKIDEIKSLIESGFDDEELIAFELDIPIEQVRQCKKNIEASKQREAVKDSLRTDKKSVDNSSNIRNNSAFNEEDYKAHVKMQKMRDRFSSLSSGKKKKQESSQNSMVSLKGIELIKERVEKSTGKERKRLISQFVDAIESRQSQCTDIEELQYLLSMITREITKTGGFLVEGVKGRIFSKITKLKQQQAVERLRNDISDNIVSVISDLVSGKIDMQRANAIIDEEAKRKFESAPKTKFALSEEAQRRQILHQIGMAIVEKAEKYPMQSPETIIPQLQELLGIEKEEAIRKVVKNCIERKKYQVARVVCAQNDVKNEYGYTVKYIADLMNEIKNAEFGDTILNGINSARTYKEERAYIEIIQKALNSGNIKPITIFLAKSRDGQKNITLADIWEDEKQVTYNR